MVFSSRERIDDAADIDDGTCADGGGALKGHAVFDAGVGGDF